jgi:putative flippase GtrA
MTQLEHDAIAESLPVRLYRRLPSRIRHMMGWRFIKFGMVGASGTVINIAVLYASQEYLLRSIADFHQRLNGSIALAITCATVNNFYWNRKLTWHDRRHDANGSIPLLFAKYVMAAGLSIALQSLLTRWVANYLHYTLANLLAIAAASIVTYLANDRLTFRRRAGHRAP